MGTSVDAGSVTGDRWFRLADSHGEVRGRWVAGWQAAVCITGSLGSCPCLPVVPEARWSRWAPAAAPLQQLCVVAGHGWPCMTTLQWSRECCARGVKVLSVLSEKDTYKNKCRDQDKFCKQKYL